MPYLYIVLCKHTAYCDHLFRKRYVLQQTAQISHRVNNNN
nr:MAG TPA: hypothetical protein [Caudoviricetes sp.]